MNILGDFCKAADRYTTRGSWYECRLRHVECTHSPCASQPPKGFAHGGPSPARRGESRVRRVDDRSVRGRSSLVSRRYHTRAILPTRMACARGDVTRRRERDCGRAALCTGTHSPPAKGPGSLPGRTRTGSMIGVSAGGPPSYHDGITRGAYYPHAWRVPAAT